MADLIVVNKADGELKTAEITQREYKNAAHISKITNKFINRCLPVLL